MKKIRILILILLLLPLTGCWNYRELEDLAIVSALGIDISDNDFDISVEAVNPLKVGSHSQSGSSSEDAPIAVFTTKGKTIREAVDKILLTSPKRLYLGHMNLLVISEEAAKKGIDEFIDYFMRDTEMRKSFAVVVIKNAKASDVLKILQPIESVTAANLQSSLETTNKYYGEISNLTLEEIVMCLFTKGRHPIIPTLEIIGDPKEGTDSDNVSTSDPKTIIKLSGSAVFKDDKLINYFDEDESLYYSIIRNKAPTTSLSFPCGDKFNYANIVIDGLGSELEVTIDKDMPKVKIDITGKSAITEFNCKMDLKNPSNLKKIEDMANKEMKKNMNKTIKKVQKFNSDVFGFEEQLYRNNYKYWDKNKKKWDEIFPNIKVKINSNIKIERISSSVETAKSR